MDTGTGGKAERAGSENKMRERRRGVASGASEMHRTGPEQRQGSEAEAGRGPEHKRGARGRSGAAGH